MTLPRAFRIAAVLLFAFGAGAAAQQKNEPGAVLASMAGTWKVEQRMWPGPGAEPVGLPPVLAERRQVSGSFVQEVMQPLGKTGEPFTRVAYLNFNPVSRRYEYFSIDSRAPQAMYYESPAPAPGDTAGSSIRLEGGTFLAPRWGEMKDTTFAYRLELATPEPDRQVLRLFLKAEKPEAGAEFLAFEYVYQRV